MDDSGSFFFIFIMVFALMMLIFSMGETTGPYETRGECLERFTICVQVEDGFDAAEGAEPR